MVKGLIKSFEGKRAIQLTVLLLGVVFELVILYLVLFLFFFGRNS